METIFEDFARHMFTGLVETKTPIRAILAEPGGIRLALVRPAMFDDIKLGDSIAIAGCCLTVVELSPEAMAFQAGEETLSKTTLGRLQAGDWVNCERSLKLGDRLGGHLVSGHVDGRGEVVEFREQAEWVDLVIAPPEQLRKQIVPKGSVAVEGVSLTVVDVSDRTFSIALIPHTLQATTLSGLRVGAEVNLETDMLAKYVQRQLEAHV
jgi:riboflavin synthase